MKLPSMWIKNKSGEQSSTLTFVTIAFSITMIHMVLGMFVNPFGIQITPFNASESMIILSPLLATYWGRRHTESSEKKEEIKTKGRSDVATIVNENE